MRLRIFSLFDRAVPYQRYGTMSEEGTICVYTNFFAERVVYALRQTACSNQNQVIITEKDLRFQRPLP